MSQAFSNKWTLRTLASCVFKTFWTLPKNATPGKLYCIIESMSQRANQRMCIKKRRVYAEKILLFSAIIVLITVNLGACAPEPASVSPTGAATPVKFGIVLVGPYNDHGWSEAHYMAANYVKAKLPGSDFIYLDKLNPADRKDTTLEQVVTDMASKGIKLIITTSDDFQTDTITAAQKHPELTFINASGDSAWKERQKL